MPEEFTPNKFDDITLNYAINARIISKIEDRFESYAIYILECIDRSLKKRLNSFSKKHEGYSFKQDFSGHDEYCSSVIVSKDNIDIVEFVFGFDYDIKICDKRKFKYSKEGYSFFTQIYFYKEIVGDKLSFNKYWETYLKEFCQNNHWAIHNHKDDNNKWVYMSLLPIDDSFTFKSANQIVIDDIVLLFKNKTEFSVFSDKIPNQKKLPVKIQQ